MFTFGYRTNIAWEPTDCEMEVTELPPSYRLCWNCNARLKKISENSFRCDKCKMKFDITENDLHNKMIIVK